MSASEAKSPRTMDYLEKCKALKAELKIDFDEELAVKLLELVRGDKDQHRHEEDLKHLSLNDKDEKLIASAVHFLKGLNKACQKHTPSPDRKKTTPQTDDEALKTLVKRIKEKIEKLVAEHAELADLLKDWNLFFQATYAAVTTKFGKAGAVAAFGRYKILDPWPIEAKARANLAKLHQHLHTPTQKKKLITALEEIHFLIGLYSCAEFLFPESTKIKKGLSESTTGTAMIWFYLEARILLIQVEQLEAQLGQEQKQSPAAAESGPPSSPPSPPQSPSVAPEPPSPESELDHKEQKTLSSTPPLETKSQQEPEKKLSGLSLPELKALKSSITRSVIEKINELIEIKEPSEAQTQIQLQLIEAYSENNKLIDIKQEVIKKWNLKEDGPAPVLKKEDPERKIKNALEDISTDCQGEKTLKQAVLAHKDKLIAAREKLQEQANQEVLAVLADYYKPELWKDMSDKDLEEIKEEIGKSELIEEKESAVHSLKKQDQTHALAGIEKEIARRKQIKEAEEKAREDEQKRLQEQQNSDAKQNEPPPPAAEKKDGSNLLATFKKRKIPPWEWLLLGIVLGGGTGVATAANSSTALLLPTIIGLGSASPFIFLGALGIAIGLAVAALFQSLPRTKENQEPLWWLAIASTLMSGVGIALLITLLITVHPAIDTLIIAGVIGTLTALLFLAMINFVVKKMSEAGIFGIEIEGDKPGVEARKSDSLERGLNHDRSPVVAPNPSLLDNPSQPSSLRGSASRDNK